MKAYQLPSKTIERSKGHYQDWIEACKGGKAASSNFDCGRALTEMVLLALSRPESVACVLFQPMLAELDKIAEAHRPVSVQVGVVTVIAIHIHPP